MVRIVKLPYKNLIKLVGIIIFIVLLIKIDIKKAIRIIINVDLPLLILAFGLSFIVFLFRTFRWKSILDVQGYNYKFIDLFKTNLGASYFASVTPGQIGELIKVYYLNQYKKIHFGRAFSSIIVDRFMNLPFLLTISIIGIMFFPVEEKIKFVLVSIFVVCFLGIIFLALSKKISSKILRPLVKIGFLNKRKIKLKNYFREFFKGIQSLFSFDAIKPIGISIIGLAIVFFQAYILASSLSIEINIIYLCAALSISMVITLIPVSFLGIGTRDVILILLFTSIGLGAESAISFSFLFLMTCYIFIALVGSYVWFKYPINYATIRRKNKKTSKITDST